MTPERKAAIDLTVEVMLGRYVSGELPDPPSRPSRRGFRRRLMA